MTCWERVKIIAHHPPNHFRVVYGVIRRNFKIVQAPGQAATVCRSCVEYATNVANSKPQPPISKASYSRRVDHFATDSAATHAFLQVLAGAACPHCGEPISEVKLMRTSSHHELRLSCSACRSAINELPSIDARKRKEVILQVMGLVARQTPASEMVAMCGYSPPSSARCRTLPYWP